MWHIHFALSCLEDLNTGVMCLALRCQCAVCIRNDGEAIHTPPSTVAWLLLQDYLPCVPPHLSVLGPLELLDAVIYMSLQTSVN